MTDSILFDKLYKGEEVVCPDCKKGKIVPLYPNDKHFFKCTNCDNAINVTASVVVE